MTDKTEEWTENMALQPATRLFIKLGLFLVRTILDNNRVDYYHCVIIVNLTQKNVSLKKETIIGQLFKGSVISPGVDFIQSIDEIIDINTEIYNNHHDGDETINPPTFLEGPIFEPTEEELI